MSRYLALSVVCLLFPVAARAQDEIVKDFSSTQVEKFIKDVMKSEPIKTQKTDTVYYSTPDGQFDLYLRTAPKKALFFKYPHQSLKRTQDQIDSWNAGMHFTHAFIEKGQVILQASLDLEAGLSMRQLTDFYAQIQAERLEFSK